MSPFPRQLRWFTAVVSRIAVSAGLFLEHSEGFPNPGALAIFGALVVLTAQLPVRLRGGVFLSPGLMVCMAAIVVFRDDHSLLGATLVCSLVYVRPVHFPRRPGVGCLSTRASRRWHSWPQLWSTRVLPSTTTGSAVYSAAMVVPAALAYLA